MSKISRLIYDVCNSYRFKDELFYHRMWSWILHFLQPSELEAKEFFVAKNKWKTAVKSGQNIFETKKIFWSKKMQNSFHFLPQNFFGNFLHSMFAIKMFLRTLQYVSIVKFASLKALRSVLLIYNKFGCKKFFPIVFYNTFDCKIFFENWKRGVRFCYPTAHQVSLTTKMEQI